MAKFKPGQSGNPAGKKPGTINKRTQLAKLLDPHAEALINKTIEMALSGEINALRLCIERLVPKAKDDNIKIIMPNTTGRPLNQLISEILQSIAGQEITIAELKSVISLYREDEQVATMNDPHMIELDHRIKGLIAKYERPY